MIWELKHLCFSLSLCSHMIEIQYVMAVYGFPQSPLLLLLSEGKPGLDLQLCAYNEDKRDRREDFASTV